MTWCVQYEQFIEEPSFQTFFQPFVLEEFKNHQLMKNPRIEVMDYWHDSVGKRNMPNYTILRDAWVSDSKFY